MLSTTMIRAETTLVLTYLQETVSPPSMHRRWLQLPCVKLNLFFFLLLLINGILNMHITTAFFFQLLLVSSLHRHMGLMVSHQRLPFSRQQVSHSPHNNSVDCFSTVSILVLLGTSRYVANNWPGALLAHSAILLPEVITCSFFVRVISCEPWIYLAFQHSVALEFRNSTPGPVLVLHALFRSVWVGHTVARCSICSNSLMVIPYEVLSMLRFPCQ